MPCIVENDHSDSFWICFKSPKIGFEMRQGPLLTNRPTTKKSIQQSVQLVFTFLASVTMIHRLFVSEYISYVS